MAQYITGQNGGIKYGNTIVNTANNWTLDNTFEEAEFPTFGTKGLPETYMTTKSANNTMSGIAKIPQVFPGEIFTPAFFTGGLKVSDTGILYTVPSMVNSATYGWDVTTLNPVTWSLNNYSVGALTVDKAFPSTAFLTVDDVQLPKDGLFFEYIAYNAETSTWQEWGDSTCIPLTNFTLTGTNEGNNVKTQCDPNPEWQTYSPTNTVWEGSGNVFSHDFDSTPIMNTKIKSRLWDTETTYFQFNSFYVRGKPGMTSAIDSADPINYTFQVRWVPTNADGTAGSITYGTEDERITIYPN